jgi:hypothetical protein
MIRLEDRQDIAEAVEQAHTAGAQLRPACELAGITVRTLQRSPMARIRRNQQ